MQEARPEGAAPGGKSDEVTWARPSARLRSVRRVQLGLVVVPLVLLGGGLALVYASALVAGIVAGALLGLAAVTDHVLGRRARAWAFAERHDDLLVRRGILIRRLSVVPYGRMQYLDVTAGPIERSFGLATLRMHTAAAASDARIPGLEHDVAARLRDQLASLGEAHSGGL
ncbi:MAG: PH domain-containing protein [Acidimicrobiales bacterium]